MSSHRSKFSDTPYKSAPSLSLTRKKMRMDEVKADVDRDIKNTLFTADTEEFLQKIVPAIPTIDKSLETLRKNGTFDGTRWAEFPAKPPSSEKPLYKPFAAISNAIVDTMPKEQIRTEIVYVDRRDSSPKSLESDMAAGRPDGAGAQPDLNLEALEKKIMAQLDTISSRTRSGAAKNQEVQEQYMREKKRLLGLYQLWWMCIHIVYEIKVEKSEAERFNAVKQLLAYMRQVLIEQLDRRFVLGFVLLFDELTLVLCDRSGVTMTSTPINIHEEPKKFIRIITGFLNMSPAQLGWDTAMEIYRPFSKDTKPSYRVADKFEGVDGDGRYNIHWVIDVDKDGKVEKYVTVAIISAIRSAEICGRATVVYEVVKFDEKEDPKQTYALKRYWRPIRADDPELYPSEGEIYEILDEGKADELKHVIVYHDIKVNGQIDSTLKLIRRGLNVQRYERPVKPLPAKRTETDADAEPRAERRDVLDDSLVPDPDPLILIPVDRYHTNILMPMGEVIKMFCSLLELLSCVRDFLREQKHGHDKLILHRDISTGNLLIFEAGDGTTFGRLMDYDHAKKAGGMVGIQSKIANLSSSALDNKRKLLQEILEEEFSRKAENDVLDTALKWHRRSDATHYIEDVAKSIGLGNNASENPLCMNDLGWDKTTDKTQGHKWPDFANREHGPGERTGTVPYMSAEVIARRSLFPLVESQTMPPFVHQAIQDVESLLWVLVRLCLTRKGPGIEMRREELDENSPTSNLELQRAVVRLFEGSADVVKDTKTRLVLQKPTVFEEQVVVHFHPYFEPLKPYVRRWWTTLILGYKHRGEEFYNIHGHIIRILDEAINEIGSTVTEDNEATQAEINRRKRHKEKRLATFRRQGSGTSLTPPSSPPQSLITTPPHHHPLSQDDEDSPSAALLRQLPASKKLKR